jgi:hypothetical protein
MTVSVLVRRDRSRSFPSFGSSRTGRQGSESHPVNPDIYIGIPVSPMTRCNLWGCQSIVPPLLQSPRNLRPALQLLVAWEVRFSSIDTT